MIILNSLNFINSNFATSFGVKRAPKSPEKAKLEKTPEFDCFESYGGIEECIKGKAKKTKKIEDKSYYGGAAPVCMKIYDEAQYDYKRFKLILEEIFEKDLKSINSKDAPIALIKTGVKSPKSLQEKMVSKKISSKQAVYNEIRDIIRGRIILNASVKNDGTEIINSLSKAVKQGKVNIVSISNYRPDDLKERTALEYMNTAKLRQLNATIRECGGAPATEGKERANGYLATHIIFKLPNSNLKAELQIMGPEVEKLKAVEDACYKLKNGKKADPAFKDVAEALKKVSKNDELLAQYNKYVKEAYKFERQKELGLNKTKSGEFLELDNPNLPQILDFNTIKQIGIAAKLHNFE